MTSTWLPRWAAPPPPAQVDEQPPVRVDEPPAPPAPPPGAEPPDLRAARRQALAVVAGWPIPWREAWGRRANVLALSGVAFPEDEVRAYVWTRADREAGREVSGLLAELVPASGRPVAAPPRSQSVLTF